MSVGCININARQAPPTLPSSLYFFVEFSTAIKKKHFNTNSLFFSYFSVKSLLLFHNAQVYLHTSPLCHIGGISSAHAIILVGGCHVFLPKFHALDAFDAIKEHQVTAMIAVPAMLKDLTSLLLSRYLVQMQSSLAVRES